MENDTENDLLFPLSLSSSQSCSSSRRVYELGLGLGFISGHALCCCGRTHHKQHQHHRHRHRHTYTGLMTSHMVSRIPPCAHRGAALRRALPQLRDFVNPQYLGRYEMATRPLNELADCVMRFLMLIMWHIIFMQIRTHDRLLHRRDFFRPRDH